MACYNARSRGTRKRHRKQEIPTWPPHWLRLCWYHQCREARDIERRSYCRCFHLVFWSAFVWHWITQGTVPFMAIDLLQEYTSLSSNFTHNFSHDLESVIYVLVWVCVLYQGPNEIHSNQGIEQTCLKQWASAKTSNDIQALCDQKLGQLASRSVLSDFTPYFAPLKPTVMEGEAQCTGTMRKRGKAVGNLSMLTSYWYIRYTCR